MDLEGKKVRLLQDRALTVLVDMKKSVRPGGALALPRQQRITYFEGSHSHRLLSSVSP